MPMPCFCSVETKKHHHCWVWPAHRWWYICRLWWIGWLALLESPGPPRPPGPLIKLLFSLSSDDSVEGPWEVGVVGVVGAPKVNNCDDGVVERPDFTLFELDFFPSAIKLPTTTCCWHASKLDQPFCRKKIQ